jgi:two-component system, OmpR family, response regulator
MFNYRAAGEGEHPGNRVLLVCTKRVLREELADGISAAGYIVETASSGVGGLLNLREASPAFDWLVTELGMPGLIDGRRIAYEYRFQRPLRPAIFIGAAADDGSPPEGDILPGVPDATRIITVIERLRGEKIRLLQLR